METLIELGQVVGFVAGLAVVFVAINWWLGR